MVWYNEFVHNWVKKLDFLEECRTLRLRYYMCPPFLTLLMGVFTIIAMIVVYILASRYVEEPQVAALIVIFVAAVLVALVDLVVNSFNRIAEASYLKSEFISIVSHQLRSPLVVFKWTMNMVEHEVEKKSGILVDDDFKKSFTALKENNEKMIWLVNSLLEVSRIDSRDYALKKEKLSLPELTKKVIGELKKH